MVLYVFTEDPLLPPPNAGSAIWRIAADAPHVGEGAKPQGVPHGAWGTMRRGGFR